MFIEIKNLKKIKNNERVKIIFSDGTIDCMISDIKKV